MFLRIEDRAAIVVCHREGATMKMICDQIADGYEALRASTGEAALWFCRRNEPDLMILDEGLPDLDRIEVLQAIRQADGIVARCDPNLPIVVAADSAAPRRGCKWSSPCAGYGDRTPGPQARSTTGSRVSWILRALLLRPALLVP